MKLRIRGNSVRFRLTQTETANLIKNGLVEEKTDFGNGQIFVYAVSALPETEKIGAVFQNGRIEIQIPLAIAETWATSTEVGISETAHGLQILVEKDFNCLTPRKPEEDADTFPHPNLDQSC